LEKGRQGMAWRETRFVFWPQQREKEGRKNSSAEGKRRKKKKKKEGRAPYTARYEGERRGKDNSSSRKKLT